MIFQARPLLPQILYRKFFQNFSTSIKIPHHLPVTTILQRTIGKEVVWPESCQGKYQSPIDIKRSDAVRTKIQDFHFNSGFYENKNAAITNTGYSVKMKIVGDNPPLLTGGGLEGAYALGEIDFHWPSEHTLDKQRFPLEGQFMFHSMAFKNLETALALKDNVVGLVVFYDLDSRGDHIFMDLDEALKSVAHNPNKTVWLEYPIRLHELLPVDKKTFVQYYGTLTFPPCFEGVLWNVFLQPSFISQRQYDGIKQIWDENDELITINARQPQPTNGRTIWLTDEYLFL